MQGGVYGHKPHQPNQTLPARSLARVVEKPRACMGSAPRHSGSRDCPIQRPDLRVARSRASHREPQQWVDRYSSNGWKVGLNPMKDWKAAVRTWEQNGVNHANRNENRAEQRQANNLAAAAAAKRDFGLVS